MNARSLLLVLLLVLMASGCQVIFPSPAPTPTEEATPLPATPTPTEDIPPPDPTPTAPEVSDTPVPPPTPTIEPDPRGEEAILILEPGPGSIVASPVRIAGIANPTFEQNLVVRIVLEDGTELPEMATIIQADLGERGPFELEYPFTQEGQAFILIYDVSARDGGIIHQSSVGVMLAPGGPVDIRPVDPQPEQIAIFRPTTGSVIQDGIVTVEGFALASFEQTLVVEILDESGEVIGSEVVTLATELGEPGPFSIQVAYQSAISQPGRIVVCDPSAAFPGCTHLSSVEVFIEPY